MREVARALGTSVATVRQRLVDHHIVVRRSGQRRAEVDSHLIADAYRSGQTVEQIAQQFSINPRTVRLRLGELGVPMRTLWCGIERREVTPETVLEMWKNGQRREDIANQLGVHRSTIDERLRAAGVQPRRR
jgi:DNA-binding CsgD family transcriptional regulator